MCMALPELAERRLTALKRLRRLKDILAQMEEAGITVEAPAHREMRRLVWEADEVFLALDLQFLPDPFKS